MKSTFAKILSSPQWLGRKLRGTQSSNQFMAPKHVVDADDYSDPAVAAGYLYQNIPHMFEAIESKRKQFDELWAEYSAKHEKPWDPNRILQFQYLLDIANRAPSADYVEFGSHQGLMARVIYKLMDPSCTMYSFDTFEGFKKEDLVIENQIYASPWEEGNFLPTSEELVAKYVGDGSWPSNFKTVKGWFPESFRGFENHQWRFVHIDFDLYQPIKSALELVWPNIVPGGVCVVHDYGCYGFPGAKKAVDEFFDNIGLTPMNLGDRWGSVGIVKPRNTATTRVQENSPAISSEEASDQSAPIEQAYHPPRPSHLIPPLNPLAPHVFYTYEGKAGALCNALSAYLSVSVEDEASGLVHDPIRVIQLFQLIEAANKLASGDFIELGTHRGYFLKAIHQFMNPTCTLYSLDTFEGFDQLDIDAEPEIYSHDWKAGSFSSTSPERVAKYVGNGEWPKNLKMVKGWFPKAYCGLEDRLWRFVHIDFDLYQPIKLAMETLWPQLVPGGIMIVHDYGSYGFPGARLAVDEVCEGLGILPIELSDRWSSAVIRKPLRSQ
jgi:hypothetical protein